MPKKMEMDEAECAKHKKKKGAMMIILGLLILANAYWYVLSWSSFIGAILVLAGLGKLLMRK